MNSKPLVPIAIGEVFDKLSILEIKLAKMRDLKKVENVRRELEYIRSVANRYDQDAIRTEYADLVRVNTTLWDIEDQLRKLEKSKQFDSKFIELARGVYYTNDRRSGLKREINVKLGSDIIEEKQYEEYQNE